MRATSVEAGSKEIASGFDYFEAKFTMSDGGDSPRALALQVARLFAQACTTRGARAGHGWLRLLHRFCWHRVHVMRSHGRGTHVRAEKEEEVGADLNGSASGFCVIHRMRISDTGLPIGRGPVTLIHNQDGPNFPPDGQRIDARIVNDVAVIWRGYEDISGWGVHSFSQGRERN